MGLNEGKAVVTEDSSLTLSAVYACVDRISKSIAALPWDVLSQADERTSLKAKSHPCYRLLHSQPHPLYTSSVFRRVMLTHLLLWGNFFAEIQTDGRNRPIALKIWKPWEVSVYLKDDQLYYKLADGRTLQDYEVIHLKGFSVDGLMGRSAIRVSRDTFKMGLEVQRFGNSFYENGTRLSGYMTTDSTLKTDALQNMKLDWREEYEGPGKQGKTAWLHNGWKYHQLGIPPDDAQFLDTRKFSRSEICGIFGVPPHMVMDLENATFSNIENQNIWYVTHTLMPLVVSIEEEFGRKLFRESEQAKYSNKMNLNGLMRGDTAARTAYYKTMVTDGNMSSNEVRALEDMNPYEGGDMYTKQGAQVPVDQLIAFYETKIKNGDTTPTPANA
jgi:HK97 family phage portal protein